VKNSKILKLGLFFEYFMYSDAGPALMDRTETVTPIPLGEPVDVFEYISGEFVAEKPLVVDTINDLAHRFYWDREHGDNIFGSWDEPYDHKLAECLLTDFIVKHPNDWSMVEVGEQENTEYFWQFRLDDLIRESPGKLVDRLYKHYEPNFEEMSLLNERIRELYARFAFMLPHTPLLLELMLKQPYTRKHHSYS